MLLFPFLMHVVVFVYLTGGCRNAEQLLTHKSCEPTCTLPNTYCRDVNICDCQQGFRPLYEDGSDVIVQCLQKMAGKNSTKGDISAENLALYYPRKWQN